MNWNLMVLSVWLIFIAYWIISALGNKKTKLSKNGMLGGHRARLIVLAIFIILWEVPFFSKIILSDSVAFKIIGPLFLVVGICFAVWSRFTLGTNWSSNLEIKQDHKLVTSGPYNLVRHPIYTGVIFAILGTFLILGKLNVFILLIIIAAGMNFRARIEDRLMEQEFPNQYPEYKRRVKSMIPFIF